MGCGSNPTEEDPCVVDEAPLDAYPPKQCRSKRKGKKLTCKALCNGGKKAKPNTVTSCVRESKSGGDMRLGQPKRKRWKLLNSSANLLVQNKTTYIEIYP